MGTLLDAETRRLYSWWWDSHVGPKNSKWLQENLSDMDAKVKMMMKLIEEDGDSFARRAEMYYKKRPELIKLVDDFYQAYRALAGRYDHATGALRHAHRAMVEAFPNQDSSVLAEEDSVTSFPMEEMVPPTIQAPHLIEPGDLNKDASGLSSLQFHAFKRTGLNSDEYDFMMSRKGLKELNDLLVSGESAHHHVQFAPYHVKYETPNELRTDLNPSPREQAHEAEAEAHNLEEARARLKGEKEANLLEYHKCLEIIHDLEMKISSTNRAETEVQILKQTIANLEKEKGEITLQHQKCLDTICCLENEVSQAQEEARRLSSVIVMEVAKLSSAEEQYIFLKRQTQSLQNEIDNLTETVEIQTQELLDRHEEIQRLRTGLQEEHMHFIQTQNALRALQNEVQTVKEKELRIQDLKEEFKRIKMENNCLKEQNLSSSMLVKNLNDELFCLKEMKSKLEQEVEVHVSLISSLQQDVYNLKEQFEELNQRHHVVIEQVESVGLKPDCLESSLKNLQNENLMLKEICQKNKEEEETILSEKSKNMEKLLEINVLSEDFLSHVNLKLDELRGKVKALEETCQALLGEKWGLTFEKDILACQLELTCENVKKISEQNTVLENSLLHANSKVESLKVQSKSAEESCQSLEYEKCGLRKERDSLVSELGSTQKRLEDLKAMYIEFEEKLLILEKEKELKTHQVEELQESLDLGKQELANFMQLSETRLAHLNGEIHILQEECQESKEALEGEQDKADKLEIEAFVLYKCMQDIGEKNQALLKDYQKHSEKSELLQIHNSKLEQESLEQRAEVKSLLNQVEKLRLGMHQLFKLLNVGLESKYKEKVEEDETLIQCSVQKIEEMGASSLELEDEKLQLLIERSILITLLREMRARAADLDSQKKALHRELQTKNEELMIFQSEKDGLRRQNDQLFSNMIKLHQEIQEHKAREGDLVSELQGKENEIKIWEDEAVELFGDCQVATARQLLFEKKVLELIEVCDFLDVERTAKLIDSEQVKERKYALECENEELKSNLAAYLSLTISLRDKVSTFENCLLPQNEMHETDEQEKEVDGVHGKNLCPTVADGVLDLTELHTRIEAIENAVFEMKSIMTLETVDTKVKLEAALEEIQKLSKNGLLQAKSISASKDKSAGMNLHKVIPEISDIKDGIFVKDIPLDQVSNCSSYDRGFDLHIMGQTGLDELAHESRGAGIQQACNNDLPPHETPALALEVVPRNEYSSLELQAEKELLVDKLEISKEVIGESAEGNKNILERLGSDAEKLRSIEATFLELRRKVEHHEKDRKTKNFDYRNVKWQLKEIESSIKQLSDVNAVLVKNAKAESLLYDGVEGRKMQRPSVLDQARRWSEKIGQLQLDLKRIQFLVLKLDDDNDKGKRTRNGDRKVLLRDYLYGNRERSHRKKKPIFFTCVGPLDQSD